MNSQAPSGPIDPAPSHRPRYRLYIDESGDHTYNQIGTLAHQYLSLLGVWFQQLADILAYPVKQALLLKKGLIPDPGEVFGKTIYEAVAARFNRNERTGQVEGYGFKWLP